MFKKNKSNYKIIFSNYQFYENSALTELIQKQWADGYRLCRIIGKSCNLLIFCRDHTNMAKPYIVYRKNLDIKFDEEVTEMVTGKAEVICQNDMYIVYGSPSGETVETKSEIIKNKQNILLGIPIKKCIALISTISILSIISLALKIILIERGSFDFNLGCITLYLALMIAFLFYFVGDLHDLMAGKGTFADGILFFSGRTKLKSVLFRIGDILRVGILLGSVCASIVVLLIVKDPVITVKIMQMWLIYCGLGYVYRLWLRQSYLILLLLEMFLAALTLNMH